MSSEGESKNTEGGSRSSGDIYGDFLRGCASKCGHDVTPVCLRYDSFLCVRYDAFICET